MIQALTENATTLRDELISLEKQFNEKKEQFIKTQGALEALGSLAE